ncbi:hypothetical protein QTN47_02545 [Danxiaibacter flavus]|uniref:Uncharacterized protein n=1 Tax=Danxiaibacter flavus TaxID=3049108 RepID=A0ABV3Z912_9BACT|nr:hypothetical protein QNM32_02545 [Chitinophagaceae bacterium DXS]
MKKIIFLLVIALPVAGFAQSGLLSKLKQKVKDRIEQRTDEGMDKAIDKTEEGVKKTTTAKSKDANKDEPTATTEATSTDPQSSFASYSHYDFIPGDNIVYAEDFSQDVIGEFPLKWATSSRGETVTIKGTEGKWLRMFQNGLFLSPYIKNLPENFTAEFDLVSQC